jgi:hypothetical protein
MPIVANHSHRSAFLLKKDAKGIESSTIRRTLAASSRSQLYHVKYVPTVSVLRSLSSQSGKKKANLGLKAV